MNNVWRCRNNLCEQSNLIGSLCFLHPSSLQTLSWASCLWQNCPMVTCCVTQQAILPDRIEVNEWLGGSNWLITSNVIHYLWLQTGTGCSPSISSFWPPALNQDKHSFHALSKNIFCSFEADCKLPSKLTTPNDKQEMQSCRMLNLTLPSW